MLGESDKKCFNNRAECKHGIYYVTFVQNIKDVGRYINPDFVSSFLETEAPLGRSQTYR